MDDGFDGEMDRARYGDIVGREESPWFEPGTPEHLGAEVVHARVKAEAAEKAHRLKNELEEHALPLGR